MRAIVATFVVFAAVIGMAIAASPPIGFVAICRSTASTHAASMIMCQGRGVFEMNVVMSDTVFGRRCFGGAVTTPVVLRSAIRALRDVVDGHWAVSALTTVPNIGHGRCRVNDEAEQKSPVRKSL